jgi:hypothetical protein
MTLMRRLPHWRLAGVLAALVCAAAILAALVFAQRSGPTPARNEVATDPVYFDDGIVFTPKVLPHDAHYLTADEAWTKWEHGDHLRPDITPEFGLLNNQGHYHLAWGFSQRGCMMPLGNPTAREVALAKSPKCRLWTFLNPATGLHILSANLEPTKP